MSEEKEPINSTNSENSAENAATQEEQVQENVALENEEASPEAVAEEKYNALNDRFLRLYADFENLRKKTAKEKVELISSASSGILKELLPVLDNFDRAIANNEQVTEVEAMKEGFALIHSLLKTTVEKNGLTPIDTIGQPFNTDLHEAIAHLPVNEKAKKGCVIEQVEKGYYLNDKVIRFAKVVVGQ